MYNFAVVGYFIDLIRFFSEELIEKWTHVTHDVIVLK